ncbi:MAG: Nif11-like leader peptide family natural product precursor [bacterium]|nr:Nif11-like leader peptide family natural product precursor [bacterium]
MSVEKASEFLARLKSDEALLAKMQELGEASERRALAEEMGFSFSKEDMLVAIHGVSEELTDTELDSVAGGSDLDNQDLSSLDFGAAGGAAAAAA